MGKKKTKQRQNEETILNIPHNRQNAVVPYQTPHLDHLPKDLKVLGGLMNESPLSGLRNLETVLHAGTDQFYEGRPLGGLRKRISKLEDSAQVRKQFKEIKGDVIEAFGQTTRAQIEAGRRSMAYEIDRPELNRRRMDEREHLLWHAQHTLDHDPQVVMQRENNMHQWRMAQLAGEAEEARFIRAKREQMEEEYRQRPDVQLGQRLEAILNAEEMLRERLKDHDEETRRRLLRMARIATQQALDGESGT